jgi:hypothetical protein
MEMAAAAYNAGPGNVDKAIRKAAENGGSYIDYLPAETQNYIASTSGMGGGSNGGSGGVSGDGSRYAADTITASTSGQEAGQEERPGFLRGVGNAVDNVVHNPDGTVNKDFLLSILSGIGTMASSPSRYLGTSILQGIGGAANTYAGQEARRQDITGKSIDNRQIALEQYNQLQGQGFLDPNITFEEYYNSVYKSATPYSGGNPPPNPAGSPAGGPLNFNGTTNRFGEGITVANNQDPAFLRQFIAKNSGMPVDSYLGRQVEKAKATLEEIRIAGTTKGTDANGNQIVVPVPEVQEAYNVEFEQASNADAAQKFKAASAETLPQIAPQLNNIDRQVEIFRNVRPGDLTTQTAEITSFLKSFDIPLPSDWNDPSQVQQALKDAAQATISQFPDMQNSGVGAQLAQIDQLSGNRLILAIRKAGLERQRDMYTMRDTWHQGKPDRNNQLAYQAWFDKEHPYDAYYKKAMEDIPPLKGASNPDTPDDEVLKAKEGDIIWDGNTQYIKKNGEFVPFVEGGE